MSKTTTALETFDPSTGQFERRIPLRRCDVDTSPQGVTVALDGPLGAKVTLDRRDDHYLLVVHAPGGDDPTLAVLLHDDGAVSCEPMT